MRPRSIIWFERIIFATLFLGLIQSYLSWDATVAVAAKTDSNPAAFVLTVLIFVFVLYGTLTLLVSRRRSKIALWVTIALFVLGLPASLGIIASGNFTGFASIAIAQAVGQLIAYGLLFTPSSRHWLKHEQPITEVFS